MTLKMSEKQLKHFNEAKALAISKNGLLLSDFYKNSRTKMLWKCNGCDNILNATYQHIKQNWCKTCCINNLKNKTNEKYKKIGDKNEFLFLKKEKNRVYFNCKNNHEISFYCSLRNLEKKLQCYICKKESIFKIIENIISSNDGKINNKSDLLLKIKENISLSTFLKNKISIKCKNNHISNTYLYYILKEKRICYNCVGSKNFEISISDCQNLAVSRGGLFLSKNYINAKFIYLWKCHEDHEFNMSYNSVKNGHWCNICSKGRKERICRAYFEKIFENKFPTSFPSWLINDKGNQLELDGFCEDLKIAFEYNGPQHYKNIYNKSDFKNYLENDRFKIDLCNKFNIKLIIIKDTDFPVLEDNFRKFLLNEFNRLNIKFINNPLNIKINLDDYYVINKLTLLQKKVQEKEGIILDGNYLTNRSKFKIQCKRKHEWQVEYSGIMRGNWCKKCFWIDKKEI